MGVLAAAEVSGFRLEDAPWEIPESLDACCRLCC